MEISQLSLARLSLIAFFLGIVFGILYDVLRVTRTFWDNMEHSSFVERLLRLKLPFLAPRKTRKRNRFLCVVGFFEDFVFCILVSMTVILLFYQGNNGKLRIPVLLCAVLGFLLCHLMLSRPIMRIAEVIVFSIETMVRYACFFALLPFRILLGRLKGLFKIIVQGLVLRHEKKKRVRYTNLQTQRIDQDACGLIFTLEKGRGERNKHGTRKEKAIQSESSGKDISWIAGRHFHRRFRKQHDEL